MLSLTRPIRQFSRLLCRHEFYRRAEFALLQALTFLLLTSHCAAADKNDAVHVGSRRQLFVDGHLIESLVDVHRQLHHPVKRNVAIAPEHPWEKYGVSYMVAIPEDGAFKAWYRVDAAAFGGSDRISMTAYAESADGITWHKPKLGIIDFNGSKQNNLVWNGKAANLAPFRDDNPDAKPEERYKAIARSRDLMALVSPDGLHWKLASETPISTNRPFDSHNIAFWDSVEKQYVAYTRGVRKGGPIGRGMDDNFIGGVRWVRRMTSKDFRTWNQPEAIKTAAAPAEEFYTNATIRYARAPDYLLMFPSRFASAREPTPQWRFGKGVNDIVFLSSRDGLNFDRSFMEAFIRPGLDQGNWHERSLYMERGILESSPTELSLYCMQNWRLPSVHIRRYSLRPDGFVSVHAGYDGGMLTTKPIVFSGSKLRVNYSTSAVGLLRVELQNSDGTPIPGFTLDDCPDVYGDRVDGIIRWKNGADVSSLAGQSVRLRFELADSDLYAFRFGD